MAVSISHLDLTTCLNGKVEAITSEERFGIDLASKKSEKHIFQRSWSVIQNGIANLLKKLKTHIQRDRIVTIYRT